MHDGFPFDDFLEPNGSYDFYFLRHGESLGNEEGIIQGRTDSNLSPRGIEDARAAGEWFTQHKLDLIFSSPLGRAEQTAKIIQREVGMPGRKVELLTDLQEIDTGMFTGRKSKDLQVEHPHIWAEFKRHSWEAVPDAERIAELEVRSARVWEDLCRRGGGGTSTVFRSGAARKRILCVSHGGMIQWLIRATLGRGFASWMPVIRVGNCGIFQLRVQYGPIVGGPDPASTGFSTEWKLMNFRPFA